MKKVLCKKCGKTKTLRHFYKGRGNQIQVWCKECRKAYYALEKTDPVKKAKAQKRHAAYYQAHKEQHKQYYIEKYKDPKEKKKQRKREHDWYVRNKEHASETSRQWYAQPKNKERITKRRRIYDREQWRNNPKVRERKNKQKSESVKRRSNDPAFIEKRKIWAANGNHRRRIRMKNPTAPYTKLTQVEWNTIRKEANFRCLRCGKKKPLVVDHVIPLSKGGTHTAGNVQPLCAKCNHSKFTKTTDYR